MDELYEFFRNIFPTSILLTIPLVFLFAPIQYSQASNEFAIYRMQQFNFYGVSHGEYSPQNITEVESLAVSIRLQACPKLDHLIK